MKTFAQTALLFSLLHVARIYFKPVHFNDKLLIIISLYIIITRKQMSEIFVSMVTILTLSLCFVCVYSGKFYIV
jgi:hypothetical protein